MAANAWDWSCATSTWFVHWTSVPQQATGKKPWAKTMDAALALAFLTRSKRFGRPPMAAKRFLM
eukprot:9287072-Lingulodinium_polyedra.AAC.1